MYISDDRSKRRVVIYVYKLEKNQDLKKKCKNLRTYNFTMSLTTK